MDFILAIPLELRLVALFVAGLALGSLVNLAVYRLAWNKRSISPWSAPPAKAPPRRWQDRLPVLGWLGLRREARLHGRGFWVRPLVVELATGLALPGLYLWIVEQAGLFPPLPVGAVVPPFVLHAQFLGASLLVLLMLAASLIDIDEKLIPDEITVTGTLAGLCLAALFPWTLPPQWERTALPSPTGIAWEATSGDNWVDPLTGETFYATFLTFHWPAAWPNLVEGAPQIGPLALAWGCYLLWCFAMLERPWYGRHGWRRGLAVVTAHMSRQLREGWLLYALLVGIGVAAISLVWLRGGPGWVGLLTALVGLVGSGGVVWVVRLVGQFSLKKEAMGFGDVMLMMMVGAFIGWQAGWLAFFLAPFAGLVVGVAQLALRRDQYIPYGPFLCLATLAVLLGWRWLWYAWARGLFFTGWALPAIVAGGMIVMGVLLLMWRLIRDRFLAHEVL